MISPATSNLRLSIVIPVYGGEGCILELCRRLTETMDQLVEGHFEIVLVEDRSPDASWDECVEVASRDPRIKAIRLSRNFGQLVATTAGLEISRGDHVMIMDCDLQDLPEDAPRLYEKSLEGYDVVQGRRKKRGDTHRRIGTRVYFWLLNRLARTNIDWELAAYSVMSRKAVNAFLQVGDRDRNLLLVLEWLGFDSAIVDITHADRFHGSTSYSLRRLIAYAAQGLFFQTTAPLRWIVYLGFFCASVAIMGAAFLVYQWTQQTVYPGWTSLMVVMLMLGGFTLASLGLVGIYVGRVFDQVKPRPRYVVDKSINWDQA